jgi:ribosome biogenesis GTPase
MAQGVIIKALRFLLCQVGNETLECKARGRFRHDKTAPLVGDRVGITVTSSGKGQIDTIDERRNSFVRPS